MRPMARHLATEYAAVTTVTTMSRERWEAVKRARRSSGARAQRRMKPEARTATWPTAVKEALPAAGPRDRTVVSLLLGCEYSTIEHGHKLGSSPTLRRHVERRRQLAYT